MRTLYESKQNNLLIQNETKIEIKRKQFLFWKKKEIVERNKTWPQSRIKCSENFSIWIEAQRTTRTKDNCISVLSRVKHHVRCTQESKSEKLQRLCELWVSQDPASASGPCGMQMKFRYKKKERSGQTGHLEPWGPQIRTLSAYWEPLMRTNTYKNSLCVIVGKHFLRVMKRVDRHNDATGPNYTTAVIVLSAGLTGVQGFGPIRMVCCVS